MSTIDVAAAKRAQPSDGLVGSLVRCTRRHGIGRLSPTAVLDCVIAAEWRGGE